MNILTDEKKAEIRKDFLNKFPEYTNPKISREDWERTKHGVFDWLCKTAKELENEIEENNLS